MEALIQSGEQMRPLRELSWVVLSTTVEFFTSSDCRVRINTAAFAVAIWGEIRDVLVGVKGTFGRTVSSVIFFAFGVVSCRNLLLF